MGILKNLNEKIMSITKNMDKSSKETVEKMKKNPLQVSQSELVRFKAQTKLSKLYKQRKIVTLQNANKTYESRLEELKQQKGVILSDPEYEYEVNLAKFKLDKAKFNLGDLKEEPKRPESVLMQNIKEVPDKVKDSTENMKNNAIDFTNKTKENAIEFKDKTKQSINDLKDKTVEGINNLKDKSIETATNAKDKTFDTSKKVFKSTKHALSEFIINSYSRGIDAKRTVTQTKENTKNRVITGYKSTKNIIKMFADKVKDRVDTARNAAATKLSEIDQEAHRRSEERYNKRQEFLQGLKVEKADLVNEESKSQEDKQNQNDKSDDMER